MISGVISKISLALLLCIFSMGGYAQLGKITLDLQKDKPEKFKTKVLKSEKTGDKKFTIPRRFVQNTVSHYNYYFNANNKINEVIERSRRAQNEDYTQILPYYSYSLENTSQQSTDLDSVILKSTAGILLHDLRSDWVDNLYLLIGQAYYLRKDFDSAAMTFQFINYNLHPKSKKNKIDQQVVGTNKNAFDNELSIASREKRSLKDKLLSRPPSRNDALVWQARTWVDLGEYSDAAGLINTLKSDPNLPNRLKPYLDEVQGYWFFQQHMYDSAITYIEKGMPNAMDLDDQARREFLLAQLYQSKNAQDTASMYYDKAMKHTSNPLMDIYAHLNKAKMLRSNDPDEISRSISRLESMSGKYKFENYKDIIFYSAAELAMDIPDTAQAINLYLRSNQNNINNSSLKNQAFLNLGQISYRQKDYKNAFNYYDSLNLDDTTLLNVEEIKETKFALAQIVRQIRIIERQDSLQSLAALSPKEREDFLKKLSKKLRKERGISDEESYENPNAFFASTRTSPDIFAGNNNKGDWYFYNQNIRAKGFAEFKTTWGKRANTDNWRRASAARPQMVRPRNPFNNSNSDVGNISSDPIDAPASDLGDPFDSRVSPNSSELPEENFTQDDISLEGLMANIPLTKSALDSSHNLIALALFRLGNNYQKLLEDYRAAISAYETSLSKYPDSLYNGELYSNLSFCYLKTGQKQKADYYKNLVVQKFPQSKFADLVLHPEKSDPLKIDSAATSRYDQIYTLFIEGNFDKAFAEKSRADSAYGTSYWTPQLLYIESVYYIKQGNDSAAILTLNNMVKEFPNTPISQKATTMIEVLGKRKSIEDYLTNLKIERAQEDDELMVFDDTKVTVKAPEKEKPTVISPQQTQVKPKEVTLNPEKVIPAPISNASFTFDAYAPQYVVMLLNKVDKVYINEAKNAFSRYNREKFYSSRLEIAQDTLDDSRHMLIFSAFESADIAMKFLESARKDAPSELSWLPKDKYAFFIISNDNLQLLKENKKLEEYLNLINEKYPGKF